MRFLVDAQLPPALARWLEDRGYEAGHLFDRGMNGASDREIWFLADREGSVIVTKDEDFATLVHVEEFGPSIVWVRLGNTRKRELLASFEAMIDLIVDELEKGERLVVLAG